MPIYRFRCLRCGYEFRELVGFGDGHAVACPTCGSDELERLLPRFGVIYKGSGFYTTEYKRRERKESSPSSTGNGGD